MVLLFTGGIASPFNFRFSFVPDHIVPNRRTRMTSEFSTDVRM